MATSQSQGHTGAEPVGGRMMGGGTELRGSLSQPATHLAQPWGRKKSKKSRKKTSNCPGLLLMINIIKLRFQRARKQCWEITIWD